MCCRWRFGADVDVRSRCRIPGDFGGMGGLLLYPNGRPDGNGDGVMDGWRWACDPEREEGIGERA